MTPPTSTPMLPPPAFTKPKKPIAFARSPGSVKSLMISASATAETTAPPTPCTARATTSAPWDWARPHTDEASVNSVIPPRKSRRWPNRSPSRPPSSRNPPKVIMYALTTHASDACENPRSSRIEGSATFTIVTSSTIIRSPRQRTARASHFARVSAMVIVGILSGRSPGSTAPKRRTHRSATDDFPGKRRSIGVYDRLLRARPDRARRPTGSVRAYLRAPLFRAGRDRLVRRGRRTAGRGHGRRAGPPPAGGTPDGCSIRLRNASPELRELVAFMGLSDVRLLGRGLEPGGSPKSGKIRSVSRKNVISPTLPLRAPPPGAPTARSRRRRPACTGRTPASRWPRRPGSPSSPCSRCPGQNHHVKMSSRPRSQRSYGGIDCCASSCRTW